MRKWAFDGEEPHKEKRENGRLAWPTKYKFLPVTPNKCLEDDIPLYRKEELKVMPDEFVTEPAKYEKVSK